MPGIGHSGGTVSFGWERHPDHPGIEVSSAGYVRSYLKSGPGGGMYEKPRVLNPSKDQDGYLRVSVKCVDGKRKRRGVHQLVAETHLSHLRFEGAIVRHKDDNPSNNDVMNLEWGTHADNMRDRRHNKGLGIRFSADDVHEIRRLYEMGFHQREIARVFKTTQAYVHNVVTRKQRQDVA
ncbi:HNH endonuclease [Mycobacteroides abscessus]|uniref:HNH endonuclease n=1 Tax=Mycobacteroides abscessus TaxID=36809 RepID=UPI003A5CB561|nr:HNH endonuclease [Mycobacterium phage prophiT49-3]